MKWFGGSIEDAVSEAKQKNSYFVVFIEGYDKSSETMSSLLNSYEISTILESENYISVRVKSDTEEFQHFVQIYKHVPVPSFFVIGLNGIPMAVVSNLYGEDVNTLYQQIKSALEPKGKILTGKSVQVGADLKQSELICKEIIPLNSIKLDSDKNVNNEISVHDENFLHGSPVNGVHSSMGNIEKQNKKDNILSNNSSSAFVKQTTEADSEMNKQRKEDNIAANINFSKGKRHHDKDEDTRMQELQQEKIKLERERQRILYDIAIDKQERLLRQQIEKRPNSPNSEAGSSSTTASPADQTQIQFRKPDGSTHTNVFDKRSVINELHTYVVENMNFNSRRFKLGTAFPRHIFTEDESSKSLEELNLVPNAVIIIIPIIEDNSPMTYVYTQIHYALSYVYSPIVSFYCFARDSLLQTTQPQIQQGVLRPPQEPTDSPSSSSRIAARNRKIASHQANSMSQRNVHTMAHISNDRSDDRNNVWNGNSTQQSQ